MKVMHTRGAIFSPGSQAVEQYPCRPYDIDGHLWALCQGDLILELQQWMSWSQDDWTGDYRFGGGYRRAAKADPADAKRVSLALTQGLVPQWYEVLAALNEDRIVRLVP